MVLLWFTPWPALQLLPSSLKDSTVEEMELHPTRVFWLSLATAISVADSPLRILRCVHCLSWLDYWHNMAVLGCIAGIDEIGRCRWASFTPIGCCVLFGLFYLSENRHMSKQSLWRRSSTWALENLGSMIFGEGFVSRIPHSLEKRSTAWRVRPAEPVEL